ncbi:MAG: DUF1569 domain-containing protein [Chitinophagales bacterium]|nr:DUF1569 domain-containing protein [Chitinophagales bacterium]
MAKSLFDTSTQQEIQARLNQLNENSTRKWGKMSVSQMLKHMDIAFAVPIKKITVEKDKLFVLAANPVTRFFIVTLANKWPKNLMTAKEFIVETDENFNQAKTEFLQTYNAFLIATDFSGVHPIFGVMKKEMWGTAMYKHLNHHLEQFGV